MSSNTTRRGLFQRLIKPGNGHPRQAEFISTPVGTDHPHPAAKLWNRIEFVGRVFGHITAAVYRLLGFLLGATKLLVIYPLGLMGLMLVLACYRDSSELPDVQMTRTVFTEFSEAFTGASPGTINYTSLKCPETEVGLPLAKDCEETVKTVSTEVAIEATARSIRGFYAIFTIVVLVFWLCFGGGAKALTARRYRKAGEAFTTFEGASK